MSEIKLMVRMTAWMSVLPLLKRALPIQRLVRLMSQTPSRRHDLREDVIVRAAWRVSRLQQPRFPDNCLERSLLVYRYLGRSGATPCLHMGVRSDRGVVTGHAWVTVDERAVVDTPAHLDRFRSVVAFDASGSRTAP